MPIRSHVCEEGHETDVLYTTFAKDEAGPTEIECTTCSKPAKRVEISRTLEPMLYGNPAGFHKPSPTRRYSYKTVSQKEGNKSSAG